MKSLKKIAEKELTLSDLMVERDKIDTEEIIDTYENGITLDQIDMCKIDDEEVAVYTFREDKDVFAFGGHILKNLFKSWIEEYGSIEEVNKALVKENIVLTLSRGKTKDGKREITKVAIN